MDYDRTRRALLRSINESSWLRLWENGFGKKPNLGSNISYVAVLVRARSLA